MRGIAILVVCACSSAPPPRRPPPPAVAKPVVDQVPFGPDERANELAALRDALRDNYAHLETKQRQWGIELDGVFAKYLPAMRAAETWSRFELVSVGFISEFHDGHLQWRRKRGAAEGKRRLVRIGVDTVFVGDALIVSSVWPGSAAARAGLSPGDRIVALDGDPIEHRLRALAAMRSWSRAEAGRYDFAQEWPASRIGVDAPVKPRKITRERDGKTAVLAIDPETAPRSGAKPQAIELEWRNQVAILHVRSLRGHVKNTVQLASDAAAAIFAKPHGLVIDLRDNDGGFEDGALAIVAQLSAKQVVGGTTRVRLSTQARAQQKTWRALAEDPSRPGWSAALPLAADGRAPNDYPAGVAVVIDAGCRSACESLALLLHAMGARLYGERTGGAGGAPISIELPNSKATVSIPARASFDLAGTPIEGFGVGPDEQVAPARADIAAGRDVALERAIDHVCPQGHC